MIATIIVIVLIVLVIILSVFEDTIKGWLGRNDDYVEVDRRVIGGREIIKLQSTHDPDDVIYEVAK